MSEMEFHQQMQEAYRQQHIAPRIELSVSYEDFKRFKRICDRYNFNVQTCFHYLVSHA
jgi:hypothetical protein